MRPRCRWDRVLAALALSLALASGSGAAQELREVDLGGGLAVVQRWQPNYFFDGVRWRPDGVRWPAWHPVGFSFGNRPGLGLARAFARVPTMGRIVAVLGGGGVARAPTTGRFAPVLGGHPVAPVPTMAHVAAVLGGRVLYTDDLGASWHEGRWDWRQPAHALAFDTRSSFGVAVGDSGYVWNTHDGGETWRSRRSGAGVLYTHVAVLGRVCVTADSHGNIWRSRDGGFQRNLVTRSRDFSLRTEGDTIVIRTTRRTFLVHRDGRIERRRDVHAR